MKSKRNVTMAKRSKLGLPMAGILALLFPLPSYGDDKSFGGEIELAPTFADVSGNEAKFNEYRDIDDGLYGSFRLWSGSGAFFFNMRADDILHDTQNYRVDGGTYGKYTFELFYNEIPHNLTFDALTPFVGAGSGTLSYSGAGKLAAVNPAVTTWNTFDYSIERRQGGGSMRFNMLKPYYLDLSFNQEKRDGIKPTATSWNASPGGGSRRVLELPEPVDYVTNSLNAELGYSLNPFFGALSYAYSKFDNENNNLLYGHPFSGNQEAVSLAPDNDFHNLAFKGRALLPYNSALSVKAERGVAETSTLLRSQYLSDVGAVTPITLSDSTFDGKVATTSYDVAIASSPLSFADGKLFYKYHERENKSDEITFDNAYSNHLFDYDRETFGASVDFRLPADISLTPSYKHIQTERHRGDFPETKDNVYAIDARWQGLDYLVATVGYEMLDRRADWRLLTSVVSGDQATANRIEPYLRRFDAAPRERDTYKIALDITPLDDLNIGLGYRYRKSDYTDTNLGLREEKSNSYDLSADYVLGIVTLSGYVAYEETKAYQFQRRLTSAANGNPALGFNAANNYNWSLGEETENHDYGVSAELNLVPDKWKFAAQYDHVRSNGLGDFTLYDGAVIGAYTNATLDILNFDFYKKSSFLIKAVYNLNKEIATTFGYAFERYYFSDAQLDDYNYRINSTDYLTGAYRDQNYQANVLFCTLKYSF